MKKYLSVLMLHIWSFFRKAVMILLIMSASQLAFALLFAKGVVEEVFPNFQILGRSGINSMFGIGYVIFMICMFRFENSMQKALSGNSRSDYTVQRLGISDRSFYLLNVLSDFLYFILFWAAEACTMVGIFRILADNRFMNGTGWMSYYLFTKTNDLFVSIILPVNSPVTVVLGLLLLLSCSFVCASRASMNRKKVLSEEGIS